MIMMQNIFVGILAVIAIGSGILGWRIMISRNPE
jgi:hypothetical protein